MEGGGEGRGQKSQVSKYIYTDIARFCIKKDGTPVSLFHSSSGNSHNLRSDYSATAVRYLCVSKRPVLSLPVLTSRYEIFNVRNDFSACCAHEGVTNESAQELTRKK